MNNETKDSTHIIMPQPENGSSAKPDSADWTKPGTYKPPTEEGEEGRRSLFKVVSWNWGVHGGLWAEEHSLKSIRPNASVAGPVIHAAARGISELPLSTGESQTPRHA